MFYSLLCSLGPGVKERFPLSSRCFRQPALADFTWSRHVELTVSCCNSATEAFVVIIKENHRVLAAPTSLIHGAYKEKTQCTAPENNKN